MLPMAWADRGVRRYDEVYDEMESKRETAAAAVRTAPVSLAADAMQVTAAFHRLPRNAARSSSQSTFSS